MKKNKSILGFFKPVSQQTPPSSKAPVESQPRQQSQPAVESQTLPDIPQQRTPSPTAENSIDVATTYVSPVPPSWSPIPPPSPVPPPSQPSDAPTPPPGPLSRDAVIQGSDDEDDDSDWSMPDMDTLLGPTKANSPKKAVDSCKSPVRKRIATFDFHKSPMTIRQAKHKYDMKSLRSHAENDYEISESARRVADLFAKEKEERVAAAGGPGPTPPATSEVADGPGNRASPTATKRDQINAMIAAEENEDLDKERLTRAFNRTELTAVREQWYFFRANPSKPVRDPFPWGAANGRWRFLRDAQTRRSYLVDGLAQQIFEKKNDLPDEIFMWMLDEICVDADDTVRHRYTDLLSTVAGADQVRRLVDHEKLSSMFQRLGSRWESTDLDAKLEPSASVADHYAGRDWSRLRSLLRTLSRIARHMNIEAKICAVQLLVRLGLDTAIIENVDIFVDYQKAFEALTSAVPISMWERFCEDICSSFYLKVEKPALRRQALSCMPTSSPKPHELRRRLAAVFLFDDIARARQSPEATFSIHSVLDRLAGPDFQISHSTNHENLAAMVWFIDIFIDDGSRDSYHSREAQDEFNSDVDRLTVRIKTIWRQIGMPSTQAVAKLESKTVLECLQHRLTHSVRTRRPQRQKLFETKEKPEDKSLPKQREYMKNFFQKKSQPVGVSAAV